MRRAGERPGHNTGDTTGELAIVEALRTRRQPLGAHSGRDVRLGIGDDCALLRPRAGEEIAVTTDFSLEGRHFRRDWHAPEAVGHRCLARGLSDLAAMGARPMAAFLSLAVPRELTAARAGAASWVERFFDGLLALAEVWKVPLAGGDTAESSGRTKAGGLVAADIVLIGGVERGRALRRSGARAGDVLYVTGALGGAAAELRRVEGAPGKFRRMVAASGEHPHLFPQPRVGVGRRLVASRLATAAIDVSDGLSTDLRHLCDESGLGAEVDAAALPVHALAAGSLELALHGGEDYELLFTCAPGTRVPAKVAGVPVRAVGRMLARRRGAAVVTLMEDGRRRPLEPGGWEHFR